jgi:fibronectin-binding autotransporter adhesin
LACLLGGALSVRAATTTYTTAYSGGTINPGDTVLLNDGATVTGAITDNGTLQFNQSAGNTLTISNLISGTGTLSLTNTGTLNLTGTSGAANTVVLDMTTSASLGVLQMNAASGNLWVGGSGTGTLNVTGGYVSNNAGSLGERSLSVGTATVSSGTWANSGNLTVGSSGTGTLTMTGGLVSVSGTLSKGSYGTINLNSGGTLQIGVGGTTGVLGVSTLTNNGTLLFNRSDASTYTGSISGTGAVSKQGGGTLNFTGTSNYTGATAVNGGKLLVNGQLGNTAVAVNAGGLLGGSGRILGNVTVASSGTLSPGNSPGVLTVGSLSLMAGSHTAMEITGTSGSLYDQIVGTGSGGLTYGGSLDLVMSGSYANGTTFHLFSNFSSPSIGDFAAVGLSATGEYAGLTFSDSDHVGGVWTSSWTTNHQRLVFTTGTGDLVVVPEPSTYAMALAGLACGGWQMWRRRLRQASILAA